MTRILVIDDDAACRRFVRIILESMPGTKVVEASDGAEGLHTALEQRPDIILLDIVMPVMDGIEFLKRSSADAELSNVPIMMITAVADRRRIFDSVSYGARDYSVKPLDPDGLLTKVKRLLSESVSR